MRETVQLEPGYVLHQRDYRDSSRLLECFSVHHGRIALVARGARRPRSPWRSTLMPFRPVFLSWVRRGELGTLTAVEPGGSAAALAGDALLCAYYLNELLLRLLEVGDAQPQIFAGYVEALRDLGSEERRAAALRQFEKRLLEHLGFGLVLEHEAHGQAPVEPAALYRYLPEAGPARLGPDAVADAPGVYSGAMLLALARDDLSSPDALAAARDLYRQALELYLGHRPLRVREVARAMRRADANASHSDAPR